MTLNFRDAVSVRFYLTIAFAFVPLHFGVPLLLLLFLNRLNIDNNDPVGWLAAGSWFTLICLVHIFDLSGLYRLNNEKATAVSCIVFDPEYLLITGHEGFQLHYPRKDRYLSKEARPGRIGRTSHYLIIHAFGKKEAEFFIGFDEEETDKAVAAFEATMHYNGHAAWGEAQKAWPPGPGEDYFPLPALGWIVFALCMSVGAFFVNVFFVNTLSDPSQKVGVTLTAIWLLLTTGALCSIKKVLTRATGMWIGETSLRVRHANGKTVEYPYERYAFDKEWVAQHRGAPVLVLQVLQDGKIIKRFALGSEERSAALLETVFSKLSARREEALNK